MISYRRTIPGPISDLIRHQRRGIATRLMITILFEAILIGCGFQALFLIALYNLSPAHLNSNSTNRHTAYQLAALSNGQRIWTQLGDGEILTIEPATQRRERVFLPKTRSFINSVVSGDGSTYMYTVDGKTLSIVRNQELLVYEEIVHFRKRDVMALSSNGETAIQVTHGTNVRWWDLTTDNPALTEFELPIPVEGVAIDPPGKKFAVYGYEGWVSVYDLNTHRMLNSFRLQQEITGVPAISVDDRWISIPCSHSIVVYDLVSEQIAWNSSHIGPNGIASTVISPDGKWVASIELFNGVQLFELSTGQLTQTITSSFLNKLAFSPLSTSFYTSSNDNLIREWSTSTGHEINRIVLSE